MACIVDGLCLWLCPHPCQGLAVGSWVHAALPSPCPPPPQSSGMGAASSQWVALLGPGSFSLCLHHSWRVTGLQGEAAVWTQPPAAQPCRSFLLANAALVPQLGSEGAGRSDGSMGTAPS